MAYATSTDFLARYDYRTLADLISDAGSPVGSGSFGGNANLSAMLNDASGWIDSAVLCGNRYTPTDLTSLTGVDQAFLIRLTCDLAYGLLILRRGHTDKPLPMFELGLDTLAKLRTGERVFNVADVKAKENVTSGFITSQAYSNINLARDYAHRYFPIRRDQKLP